MERDAVFWIRCAWSAVSHKIQLSSIPTVEMTRFGWTGPSNVQCHWHLLNEHGIDGFERTWPKLFWEIGTHHQTMRRFLNNYIIMPYNAHNGIVLLKVSLFIALSLNWISTKSTGTTEMTKPNSSTKTVQPWIPRKHQTKSANHEESDPSHQTKPRTSTRASSSLHLLRPDGEKSQVQPGSLLGSWSVEMLWSMFAV